MAQNTTITVEYIVLPIAALESERALHKKANILVSKSRKKKKIQKKHGRWFLQILSKSPIVK